MRKELIATVTALTVALGAAPASAGFFLEGLRPFTQEPRCPDPYATNKAGCELPDPADPAPTGAERDEARPDVRERTRDGAPQK